MQSFSSLSQIEGKSYKVLFSFFNAKIPPLVSGGDKKWFLGDAHFVTCDKKGTQMQNWDRQGVETKKSKKLKWTKAMHREVRGEKDKSKTEEKPETPWGTNQEHRDHTRAGNKNKLTNKE